MTARFALKAATDDIHRELDERLSTLDLAAENDYRRFLDFHARTVPAVEASLASGGLGDMVEGWCASRRSDAIAGDLAALGEPMPKPVEPPVLTGVGELLGAAYVLEGSRLGGRVLERRVGPGLPNAFLKGDGSLGPWPPLIAVMDRLLYSDSLLGEAKSAARRCFTLFLTVAHEAGI